MEKECPLNETDTLKHDSTKFGLLLKTVQRKWTCYFEAVMNKGTFLYFVNWKRKDVLRINGIGCRC